MRSKRVSALLSLMRAMANARRISTMRVNHICCCRRQRAYHLCGGSGTLRSLLATAEAIEQHLRLTGLGAIPLLNAHTSEPIDIQQLINARSKDAQIGFDQKQRAKEASDAISRRP